ncbi:MAG: metallophosphoesterase, partial [Bacteroidales bacterium]
YRLYSKPQLTDLSIAIKSNKGQLDDLKIIAASDLHLGMIIQKTRLAEWVEMINKQEPDIVLLVGDIFDRSLKPYDSQGFIDEFKKLKSKYGVYSVLGNHDYYAKVDRSVDYLKRSGIKLLRDESFIVDNRLMLIGRDDATNHKRKPLESLMSETDLSLPTIFMVHQPTHLHEITKYNIDFQISGHTHDGQIFPGNLLAKRIWELSYGYGVINKTQFYVSSGLGLSYIPIRIGTHSEIVRIHFRSENDSISGIKNH